MGTFRVRVQRGPRVLEKVEQGHTVQLLASIGAKTYTIGTRRSRGKPCPKCHTFVAEHQGTRQTEGIADLLTFLPWPAPRRHKDPTDRRTRLVVFIESKAVGGRMSAEQREFREFCLASCTDHVVGEFDAVIEWLIDRGYVKSEQFAHYRQPGVRT